MTSIPASEIKYKKQVGKDGGDAVFEVATVGGLHLILAARKKGTEPQALGCARAVARHLAQKKAKGLTWTELSKAEHVDERYLQHLIPKWELITDFQRAKESR